jgi:hypothetical protein
LSIGSKAQQVHLLGRKEIAMHILSNLLRRIGTWLTAVDAPLETTASLLDWADLPPYHPSRD